MIHIYIEIDIDDNYLYHKLIGYTCMLSIGCTPMIIITLNMAKTWLKVFNASCCRLKSLYHLKHLYVQKSTAWSCWVSLAEWSLVMSSQSCWAYSLKLCFITVVCKFLFSSLPVLPLMGIIGKSKLWVLDFVLDPVVGVELLKEVFTSRARWIFLWCQVNHFH
jgi:hypothetical protein